MDPKLSPTQELSKFSELIPDIKRGKPKENGVTTINAIINRLYFRDLLYVFLFKGFLIPKRRSAVISNIAIMAVAFFRVRH